MSYKLDGHILNRVQQHPYLGVTLSSDLKWASHVDKITASAKQTLGVIKRNFRHTSKECKARLYCSLVRPKLEYANAAWYPHLEKDKYKLDMVQRSAARLCCNNYSREPGSVTGMLKDLRWPTLETRRKLARLSMFHRIYYGSIDLDKDLYLTPVARTSRNCHPRSFQRPHGSVTGMLKDLRWPTLETRRKLARLSMFHRIYYGSIDLDKDLYLTPVARTSRNCHPRSFQRPHSNCNQHVYSFFPWTTKQWNLLPGNIVDIEDRENFKNSVQEHLINLEE